MFDAKAGSWLFGGLNSFKFSLLECNPPRKIGNPPRKIGNFLAFFGFFRSMEKMAWDGPKWGREDFFPTNPDLANMLGRTDLIFETSFFLIVWIPTF